MLKAALILHMFRISMPMSIHIKLFLVIPSFDDEAFLVKENEKKLIENQVNEIDKELR